jgi:hypothetical protein
MIARLFPICIIVEFLVCELYCASVSAICLLLLSRSWFASAARFTAAGSSSAHAN